MVFCLFLENAFTYSRDKYIPELFILAYSEIQREKIVYEFIYQQSQSLVWRPTKYMLSETKNLKIKIRNQQKKWNFKKIKQEFHYLLKTD